MRIIAFVTLTAAVLFTASFTADAAPKKSAAADACNFNACMDSCVKAGGRARLCPTYCQDKFKNNPKCK